MYAVNVVDWMARKDNFFLNILLGPVVAMDQTMTTEPDRIDGLGVLLKCDDTRGEAVVKVLRQHFTKSQLRCYHSTTGKGWKRV